MLANSVPDDAGEIEPGQAAERADEPRDAQIGQVAPWASRGNEKSTIRIRHNQQVRKISGSNRRRSEGDMVSEKVMAVLSQSEAVASPGWAGDEGTRRYRHPARPLTPDGLLVARLSDRHDQGDLGDQRIDAGPHDIIHVHGKETEADAHRNHDQ